jgi:CBS domain-containing protein
LADESIGAVPVCDASGRLRDVVTDRDLVVEIVAAGKDPKGTRVCPPEQVGELVGAISD